MKFLLILFFISHLSWGTSIFVQVKNNLFKVTTPKKFSRVLSLHIENTTSQDYYMKLENQKEVIKLFSLPAGKTYSFDFKNNHPGLKIIPLSPAFKAISLNRVNQVYEVSKIQ